MDLRTDIPKLRKIVSDSGSKLVLTTRLYMSVLHASRIQFMAWPGDRWVTTSDLPVRAIYQSHIPDGLSILSLREDLYLNHRKLFSCQNNDPEFEDGGFTAAIQKYES